MSHFFALDTGDLRVTARLNPARFVAPCQDHVRELLSMRYFGEEITDSSWSQYIDWMRSTVVPTCAKILNQSVEYNLDGEQFEFQP